MTNMEWISKVMDSIFGSRKGKTDEEDVVTKTSNFIDNHLRAFRTGTLLLAGAGILLIVKRTYLFSWFQNASDIPKEFIKKGISLGGQVKAVSDSNTVEVLHIPLITTSKFRSHKESNASNNLLSLALAGVEFKDGSNTWLNSNLLDSHIKFLPIKINQDSQISSIIHKKRGYFRRNICINEEIVKQGIAVTGNYDKSLEHNETYKKLFSRLFTAEAYAHRRHRGIWSQPTLLERIQSIKIPVASFLRWKRKQDSEKREI